MTHKKCRVPHSLIQSRIQKGVQEQLEKLGNNEYKQGYEAGQRDSQAQFNTNKSGEIQRLRSAISALEGQLDQAALTLSDKNRQLTEMSHRNTLKNEEISGLKRQLTHVENNLKTLKQDQPALSFVDNGLVVHNWRDGWKWLSNWCFALIAFFAITPIPTELLAVLPDNVRTYVIAWVAFCGMVGRSINQSRGVQQWRSKF